MTTHRIFYTELEDGNILAVSVDSPRFGVSAPTKEEAFAKAERALDYYDSVKRGLKTAPKREVRVFRPSFQQEELACA